MAVPKRRTTSSKRNMRRAHHALTATGGLSTCSNCKRPVRSHQMCTACGYYKGEEVIDVLAKLTKRERKKAERRETQEREERESQQAANET